jgi:uncharacterized membrane protein YjgN (DUF898 family)
MAKKEISPMRFKFIFKGEYLAFFGWNVLWTLVSLMTFGIATPFYVMWFIKYVVENIEIEGIGG